MEITTNHSKASEFIKAFITSYSNEVLVNKVKTLYELSEEDIQELINNESQTLDIFLDTKNESELNSLELQTYEGQQAIILKGIASKILQMETPTFEEVDKLFNKFEHTVYPMITIEEFHLREEKIKSFKTLINDIKDVLMNSRGDDNLVSWINDRLEYYNLY